MVSAYLNYERLCTRKQHGEERPDNGGLAGTHDHLSDVVRNANIATESETERT